MDEPYTSIAPTKAELKPVHHDVAHRRLTAEVMESRATAIMDVIDAYLKGEGDYKNLLFKLDKANLKDIGIFTGILTDKMLSLRAQTPNQWSPQEATKADELLVALMSEIKSRGLKVTATERKFEVGTTT